MQLVEFHAAMGQSVGSTIEFRDVNLRRALVAEEAKELDVAMLDRNMPATIDALCDLLYVVFGTAVVLGVDIEPFFDEVHRTNMLKSTGEVRADGKRLKPPGWKPPDIEGMLKARERL